MSRIGENYSRLGHSGLERRLQKMCEDIAALKIIGTRTVRVQQTTKGQILTAAPQAPSTPGDPGVVKQFRIKSIQNDYFVCREFDGTSEGEDDVNVAKAWELRRTPFHNQTFSVIIPAYPGSPGTVQIGYAYQTATYRIATIATATEHQIVLETYIPNTTVIFASQAENGTGVSDAEWIDLNLGGHAWARVA